MPMTTIRNFLQETQPMLLVLGEAQSGKSELLEQAAEQFPTLHAICLHAKQHIKPRVMVQQLSSLWSIPVEDHGEPLVKQLRTLVNGLVRENKNVFLLIDDAHLLPYSVLAALVHCATAQEDGCYLHLLLSGRISLSDKVRTLYDKDIPLIQLGKLPRYQAREHIESFLEKSHISASEEAIHNIVERLYNESHGVPSRIDKLLRELTLKDFMQPKSLKTIQQARPVKKQRVVFSQNAWLGERGARGFAVFGLVATMFGLYWYEHHQSSVSPPPPAAPYHYPLAKTFPLTAPPKHIAAASHSGYTIQLMGSFDKSVVEKRLAHIQLAQAHIFNEQYKQKPWYVLGVGNYKTHQQAALALHQLPQSVQKMGAWVRPVK